VWSWGPSLTTPPHVLLPAALQFSHAWLPARCGHKEAPALRYGGVVHSGLGAVLLLLLLLLLLVTEWSFEEKKERDGVDRLSLGRGCDICWMK